MDVSAETAAQLFSNLDPAPFRHKDLDNQVEVYILAAVREIGGPERTKIVFHLPAAEAESSSGAGLADAVHNYFSYRAWAAGEDLSRLLRTGGASLAIGLSFLFVCLLLRQLFLGNGAGGAVIAEGLLILGWVALWRPLEIALYDWWPIARQKKLFTAMKSVPVACKDTP
ncbi:MAG: hypothetical protein FJX59_12410 [Alphaproteobacteria bacterium]|nr:hypothetical protein [Alphaproteobacteria bacterium]